MPQGAIKLSKKKALKNAQKDEKRLAFFLDSLKDIAFIYFLRVLR
jgi:hypothetical protein